MKKIEFETKTVVSTHGGQVRYHDDMLGEQVWISCQKPQCVNSVDYREFNGVPIKEMAKFLEKYENKESMLAINGMSELKDLRVKYKSLYPPRAKLKRVG